MSPVRRMVAATKALGAVALGRRLRRRIVKADEESRERIPRRYTLFSTACLRFLRFLCVKKKRKKFGAPPPLSPPRSRVSSFAFRVSVLFRGRERCRGPRAEGRVGGGGLAAFGRRADDAGLVGEEAGLAGRERARRQDVALDAPVFPGVAGGKPQRVAGHLTAGQPPVNQPVALELAERGGEPPVGGGRRGEELGGVGHPNRPP